jgi:TP53 regulating kinase-like protein/N6-L-threonylcarbamoyladenine synthase/protein kinase Bud32
MSSESSLRGAEATVGRCVFMGREAVVKTRPSKGYRIPELDARIRSSRTRNEARITREARMAGVRTPCIYDVDLKDCSITMEWLEGPTVKAYLDSRPEDSTEVCKAIGANIASMHNAGICHGDLTTSNMIICDGRVCLIDFSMGSSVATLEEIGVDIRLLERAFTSAHTDMEEEFSALMESYYGCVSEPEKVRKKVEDIKNRGRYT